MDVLTFITLNVINPCVKNFILNSVIRVVKLYKLKEKKGISSSCTLSLVINQKKKNIYRQDFTVYMRHGGIKKKCKICDEPI